MRAIIRVIATIWLFCVFADGYSSSLPGTLPGTFLVGSDGSASYEIPVSIPVGTAGMAPTLSIAYNSRGANGLLGVGGALKGFSAITRCRPNLDQDGVVAGVNFDASDRFCIDGQKLVAVDGAYGYPGTVYSTELESFVRIISQGGSPGHPEMFEVRTKAGLISIYGGSVAAKSALPLPRGVAGQRVHTWNIRRTSDTSGNYIDYHYRSFGGENLPLAIEYTGNDLAGLQPYSVIAIEYEPRPDVWEGYIAGSLVTRGLRIKHLEVRGGTGFPVSGGATVGVYRMGYLQDAITGHSQLTEVQLCPSVGANKNSCQPATKLHWPSSTAALGGQKYINPYSTYLSSSLCANGSRSYGICDQHDNHYTIQYPDITGDGVPDICYRSDTGVACQVLTKDGQLNGGVYTRICRNGGGGAGICNDGDNFETIQFHDFDGDGLADLVYRGDLGVQIYRSAGNYFEHWSSTSFARNGEVSSHRDLWYPDVNGDTLPDICYRHGGGITCRINEAQQNSSSAQWSSQLWSTDACASWGGGYGTCKYVNNYANIRWADMNADGMSDLIYRAEEGVHVVVSTGSGFENWQATNISPSGHHVYLSPTDNRLFYVDINGDGLTDICHRKYEGLECYTNTGSAFKFAFQSGVCAGGSTHYGVCNDGDNFESLSFTEINGDGLADIYYRGDGGVQVLLGTGVGFQPFIQTDLCHNGNGTYDGVCNDGDNYHAIRMVDLDGDFVPEIVYRSDYGIRAMKLQVTPGGPVTKIENGLGATIEIDYSDLWDDQVYSSGGLFSDYPLQGLTVPMRVVSGQRASNGIGGHSTTEYRYSGAVVSRHGRGFLGFRSQVVSNEDKNTVEHTGFHLDFPLTGLQMYSRVLISDGRVLSESSVTYHQIELGSPTSRTDFVAPKKEVSKSWEINLTNRPISQQSVTHEYGEPRQRGQFLGNETKTTVVVTDLSGSGETYITETNNQYYNDSSNWLLGRLGSSVVSKVSTVGAAPVRKSYFEYDAQTGLINLEVVEPEHAGFRVETVYERDLYGNIVSKATRSNSGETRVSRTDYDAFGRFPERNIDPLGHVVTNEYDSINGRLTATVSKNGLRTSYYYNWVGGLSRVDYPDGSQLFENSCNMRSSYNYYCWGALPSVSAAQNVVYSKVTKRAGAEVVEFFDELGRIVLSARPRLNSPKYSIVWEEIVWQVKEYDSAGRLARESVPFFGDASAPSGYIEYTYDEVGRQVRVAFPSGDWRSTTYDGLKRIHADRDGRRDEYLLDVMGRVRQVTDAEGGLLVHEYDSAGNLSRSIAPGAIVTTFKYDLVGRKIEMSDPSSGVWKYNYDGFGNLNKQVDPKGQVTSFSYDSIGRQVEKISGSKSYSWIYDGQWLGALDEELIDGVRFKAYSYDSLGRTETVETYVDGRRFTTGYDYIYNSSRIWRIKYPSQSNGLEARYEYDQFGNLLKLTDQRGALIWAATEQDEFGQITEASLGNGLTEFSVTDAYSGRILGQRVTRGGYYSAKKIQDNQYSWSAGGRLLTRTNTFQFNGASEHFEYDALGRLTRSSVGGATKLNLGYDALGNITSHNYRTYVYGQRPYAVAEQRNYSGSYATYQYDANGNMLSGGNRSFVWDAENNLSRVTTTGSYSEFDYDGAGARFRQISHKTQRTSQADRQDDAPRPQFTYECSWYSCRFDGSDSADDRGVVQHEWSASNGYGSVRDGSATSWHITFPSVGDYEISLRLTDTGNNESTASAKIFVPAFSTQYQDICVLARLPLNLCEPYDESTGFASSEQQNVHSLIEHNISFEVPDHEALNPAFLQGGNSGPVRTKPVANEATTEVTYYINGLFEFRVRDGRAIEVVSYLQAANQTVAQVRESAEVARRGTFYLHRDHLGSVEVITNGRGELVQRMSYDPFGERRSTDGSSTSYSGVMKSRHAVERGFTNHEHLDHVNLIHMNGRVYDPTLARFISPDPFVQFGSNTQSFNRYSYLLNNPLNATDPTGYFLERIFRSAHQLSGGAWVDRNYLGPFTRKNPWAPQLAAAVCTSACGPFGALIAAGIQAHGAYLQGASFNDSIRVGAISLVATELFSGIGDYFSSGAGAQWAPAYQFAGRVVAHGAVGSATAWALGGSASDIRAGFYSGAFAAAAAPRVSAWSRDNPIAGTMISAAVGGTVSVIGGGKFANGAMTAAFSFAFNELRHRVRFVEDKNFEYEVETGPDGFPTKHWVDSGEPMISTDSLGFPEFGRRHWSGLVEIEVEFTTQMQVERHKLIQFEVTERYMASYPEGGSALQTERTTLYRSRAATGYVEYPAFDGARTRFQSRINRLCLTKCF